MTLTSALEAVANRTSGHGIRLLRGERTTARLSFDQLYEEAGRIACGLLDRGVLPSQRVALALPSAIDFARAFFGVLAAGAVPVPVPPPFRFASLQIHMRRIEVILRQSQVRTVLTNKTLGDAMAAELGGTGSGPVSVLGVGELLAGSPIYNNVSPEHPALAQYTSGTVTEPKGVVLSHANLLANVDSISRALDCADTDVCCTWLPLFHDMGLIGAFLCAVLNDIELCMLPPEDFLRDPGRWVRMISNFRGSISPAPNSAYLQTMRRVPADMICNLDLSSWRLALTGAETVDAKVLREFSAHFAPAGFQATAFLPVYGLAEGSLAVTFPPIGRPVQSIWVRRDLLSEGSVVVTHEGAEFAREVVSVGTPVTNTEIRLVAESGTVVPDGASVGEIEIRGDSVMRTYEGHQHPNASPNKDGWVSTGDLGFQHDGELFIAGRKKEMIVVFGQNYYASDIESIAGGEPGVASHGVLAVGLPFADGEGLVLFVETRETEPEARDELVARVRFAVSNGLGVTPRDVILVRRGKLPRTSSGKLQRGSIGLPYTECELANVGAEAVSVGIKRQ